MISDAVRVFGVEILEHLENKRKEHINFLIVTRSLVRFTPWISTIDVAVYVEFCSVMMFTNFHFWYFNGDHNSLTIHSLDYYTRLERSGANTNSYSSLRNYREV